MGIRVMLAAVAAALVLVDPAPGPIGGVITIADPYHTVSGQYDAQAIEYAEEVDAYLSVYTDVTSTALLKARWIDPDSGIAGAPIDLGSQLYLRELTISWNPARRHFLIAFRRDPSSIYGMVLDESGARLGSSPGEFLISSSGSGKPRVACDGADWLVAWDRAEVAAFDGRLVGGASSNAAPVFLTDPFSIGTGATDEGLSGLAFGGGADYLVLWTAITLEADESYSTKLWGRTVSPAGVLGEAWEYAALSKHVWWYAGNWVVDAVIEANDRQECLVAWEGLQSQDDMMVETGDSDPRALVLNAWGLPLHDPVRIPSARDIWGMSRDAIAVAWNSPSGQYLYTWHRRTIEDGVYYDRFYGARLLADLTIAETDIVLHERSGGSYHITPSSAGRTHSSDCQVIVQWGDGGSDTGGTPVDRLEARRYGLGPDPANPTVSSVTQRDLAGGGVIPPGGTATGPGWKIEATIKGGRSRLEAEVREVGVDFSGTPTDVGEFVPASTVGTLAHASVSSALRGHGYHWQLRAVDDVGRRSTWRPFGANPDEPTQVDVAVRTNVLPACSSPGQYKKSDGHPVELGAIVYAEGGIRFTVDASDSDGDAVSLEVEVRPVGAAFSGVPTATGPFSSNGSAEVVQVPGTGAGFKWHYRVRDSALDAGPWFDYGGNSGGEADFRLMSIGSTNAGATCGLAARPGPATGLPLLLALLLAARVRAGGR